MTTFYIRDRRSGEIVNAIETSQAQADAERHLDRMTEPEHLYLDAHPPLDVLRRYRYWDERP